MSSLPCTCIERAILLSYDIEKLGDVGADPGGGGTGCMCTPPLPIDTMSCIDMPAVSSSNTVGLAKLQHYTVSATSSLIKTYQALLKSLKPS
jgi:hypothetical protein